MRTREVIPAPLENALLATRVVAALHALDAGIQTPLVEGAFDEASNFLRTVIEGRTFAKERRVTDKSARYALAYGEAVQAIGRLRTSPVVSDEGATVLSELLRTIDLLRSGHAVPTDDRDTLRNFFTMLRDICAHSSPRPIETLSISR